MRGNELLLDFVMEFEELYYQQMESRIHFVRQSVHLLIHIASETLRLGPLSCYAQWTLETAIGNLGRKIRQDQDLYANLTQRAILHMQINSLWACFPNVKLEFGGQRAAPHRTREFDDAPGHLFLPCMEKAPSPIGKDELEALMVHWEEQQWPNQELWHNAVCHWAKLQLPNGQMARSVWYESSVSMNIHCTSCVEVCHPLFVFTTGISHSYVD
jgi:hypothetical protein